MGCCESTPTAPDVIIPDPGETEACVFTLKSMGMMSKDYVAYQGADTSDDTKKWQFVNKTGSIFGWGGAEIDIENFVRGGNPEKVSQSSRSHPGMREYRRSHGVDPARCVYATSNRTPSLTAGAG